MIIWTEIENFLILYYNMRMHPLSTFPELLSFGLLAPFLLRLACGVFIFSIGRERLGKQYKVSSAVYAIVGALLVMGLYTQITAILAFIVIIFDFYTTRKTGALSQEKIVSYALAGIILLSLLFTGPGFLAFDLPL
ncbi:MAG: hypothetical protein UT81_C0006G0017 [Parcubacteria group bacterium GW2011_GWA2_40_14]|nr:MAG: hypothetical protein UT81_C0006G0017 [Parcubacteria group bacterium GW2011_GWA2_40_14]